MFFISVSSDDIKKMNDNKTEENKKMILAAKKLKLSFFSLK